MKDSIKIDFAGNWKTYADHIPANCKVMGTVTRAGIIGALVKSGNGSYSQINLNKQYPLDVSEVEAAMGIIHQSYGISTPFKQRTSKGKPGTPDSWFGR